MESTLFKQNTIQIVKIILAIQILGELNKSAINIDDYSQYNYNNNNIKVSGYSQSSQTTKERLSNKRYLFGYIYTLA